ATVDGPVTTTAGTPGTFASGFSAPFDVAFDTAGNLYVANSLSGVVSKVTADGSSTTTFASGLGGIHDLAVDASGNLYVTGAGGAVSTFASGFAHPHHLKFNAGTLYVSDAANNTIDQVTSGGSVIPFVTTGLNVPTGLAFDGSGNLYVANFTGNTVSRVAISS